MNKLEQAAEILRWLEVTQKSLKSLAHFFLVVLDLSDDFVADLHRWKLLFTQE